MRLVQRPSDRLEDVAQLRPDVDEAELRPVPRRELAGKSGLVGVVRARAEVARRKGVGRLSNERHAGDDGG